MPIQSSAAKDDEIQFRIPLSCGQAKISKDKSNNECKVYDVVVSPKAIEKCKEDNEFRRFLVAVSMNWIQQKYEPTLNDEEFKNLNFKVKGGLEVQRVRLTRPGTGKDNKNAMGDEIKLPTGNEGGTAPTSRGPIANDKLIEEVVEPTVASIVKLEAKGSYDWSTHKSPTQNIFFKENVPKEYYVELLLPTIQTISEAEVIVTRKTVEIYSVDKEEGEEPLLRVVLDYPIDEDLQNAKFIRKKNLLKATITVKLPDETQPPESARSRDVVELEEEADRAAAALREEKYKQDLEKQRKIQEEEEEVLRQRRELVKNLSAVQEGELPPSLLEEIDAIPREQLVPFLHRLEHKVRKGDSLDTLMEKMPEETLWAVTNYIRKKLNLEPVVKQDKAPKKKVTFSDSAEKEGHAAADSTVEYNNSKKSDLLFGISFQNRYLFTLD
ncbi:hypothetical protein AGDE_11177 [Angomonas deanei]|nr:hypothetical protein AGDE_11177 [Angomonas deanei]|eukprot:EPY26618.1 hypothetical protein AGDE_11177 [Angomonas deanei]